MIDHKRIKQLDREYKNCMKWFEQSRKYSEYPIKGKAIFDRMGTITEKEITPSGGCVMCIKDGEAEVSLLVREKKLFDNFQPGDVLKFSYGGDYLIRGSILHSQETEKQKIKKNETEQQTVTVTIRTRGEKCELTDEQIQGWYRDQIESLLDPNIGEHDISVAVERETIAPYRFYGWEHADIMDAEGRTPREYYDLLKDAWCVETCAPRMRSEWSRENPTLGQCSITAFLLQDIFGGKVCGVPLPDGNFHCFNVVGDCVFDLTSEQFGDVALDYRNRPEQFRDVHFAKDEKYSRYLLLRQRLLEAKSKV